MLTAASIPVGTKLELGCGRTKTAGYVGVDALPYPGVDIVADAIDVLHQIGDDTLEEVFSAHFLEHVADLDEYMREMTRTVRPGGRIVIVVPHFSNPYFYSDPTHRRTWGLYTIGYYTPAHRFTRGVPIYGDPLPLRVDRVRLTFRSASEFPVRSRIRHAVGRLINASPWLQEFYEENLTGLVSCYELRLELRKAPHR